MENDRGLASYSVFRAAVYVNSTKNDRGFDSWKLAIALFTHPLSGGYVKSERGLG